MILLTSFAEAEGILLSGGIGVIRTDTLYGIVARAQNQSAVERVYALKSRDEKKSPIVLVSSIDQLFDAVDTPAVVASYWPGKVSIVLPSVDAPVWIRRDNHSVAYRLPHDSALQNLLNITGPLIAPSANPEGKKPASSIDEAVAYFGDEVDFYVDGGTITDNSPSKLIRVSQSGDVEVLR